ncbi:MAG: ATP-binding cassette domain-containing protein, partial [Clostridiales bacterium]|nr:ATP-binding cassette domain-containing protein [Clostridiales bacterium]
MDIKIDNLSKRYGDKQIFHQFSCLFPFEKTTAIMGPSGCGKTTLLSLLMGLTPYEQGTITGLEDKTITAVFQEDRLCENISPLYNLRLTTPKDFSQEALSCPLLQAGLTSSELTEPVRTFSGGMKRRVALVRALITPGNLLLMDEPFQGLDDGTRQQMIALVKAYSKKKTLLLVTHSLWEAQELGADILQL